MFKEHAHGTEHIKKPLKSLKEYGIDPFCHDIAAKWIKLRKDGKATFIRSPSSLIKNQPCACTFISPRLLISPIANKHWVDPYQIAHLIWYLLYLSRTQRELYDIP